MSEPIRVEPMDRYNEKLLETVQAEEDGDEPWILKDVSFTVEPGETVAIVGATGAGKTTITSLLTRFYDIQRGRILIDGIDIREMEPKRLRKMASTVLQDVFLFSGTIEENIHLDNHDITPEEVKQYSLNPSSYRL